MTRHKARSIAKLGCLLLILISAAAVVQRPATQQATAPATQTGRLERGKYLVDEVARCGECHTPHTGDGQEDRSRYLQGGTMWYQPLQSMPNWAFSAPPLAGLPSFSDEDAMRVLEKATGPNGYPVRPPMHPYHLNHEDAAAIIAYLRSLK